jgi:hypothetical protein
VTPKRLELPEEMVGTCGMREHFSIDDNATHEIIMGMRLSFSNQAKLIDRLPDSSNIYLVC